MQAAYLGWLHKAEIIHFMTSWPLPHECKQAAKGRGRGTRDPLTNSERSNRIPWGINQKPHPFLPPRLSFPISVEHGGWDSPAYFSLCMIPLSDKSVPPTHVTETPGGGSDSSEGHKGLGQEVGDAMEGTPVLSAGTASGPSSASSSLFSGNYPLATSCRTGVEGRTTILRTPTVPTDLIPFHLPITHPAGTVIF